jgi:hypothetical protein
MNKNSFLDNPGSRKVMYVGGNSFERILFINSFLIFNHMRAHLNREYPQYNFSSGSSRLLFYNIDSLDAPQDLTNQSQIPKLRRQVDDESQDRPERQIKREEEREIDNGAGLNRLMTLRDYENLTAQINLQRRNVIDQLKETDILIVKINSLKSALNLAEYVSRLEERDDYFKQKCQYVVAFIDNRHIAETERVQEMTGCNMAMIMNYAFEPEVEKIIERYESWDAVHRATSPLSNERQHFRQELTSASVRESPALEAIIG